MKYLYQDKKPLPKWKQISPHGNTPTGNPNGPITYKQRTYQECNEFFPFDCTTYIIPEVWQNGEIISEGEPIEAGEFYSEPSDFDSGPGGAGGGHGGEI